MTDRYIAHPFSIKQFREAIDAHKIDRMANPYKRHSYETISQKMCVEFWIEQVGDAEMYEERWLELETERLAGSCKVCDGVGTVFQFDTRTLCDECEGTGLAKT